MFQNFFVILLLSIVLRLIVKKTSFISLASLASDTKCLNGITNVLRIKVKRVHSFVSRCKKTNYCHLMQYWHWNTQDEAESVGLEFLSSGSCNSPVPASSSPFLPAKGSKQGEVFPSFGCYHPSQCSGRLWVLVLIQMNFYIMTKINETCSPQSLNLNMNNINNCLLRYVNIQTVIACNSKNPYFDLNWNYESSSSKIDKTLFKLAYFLHWQASWVWHIFWASYVNFSTYRGEISALFLCIIACFGQLS